VPDRGLAGIDLFGRGARDARATGSHIDPPSPDFMIGIIVSGCVSSRPGRRPRLAGRQCQALAAPRGKRHTPRVAVQARPPAAGQVRGDAPERIGAYRRH